MPVRASADAKLGMAIQPLIDTVALLPLKCANIRPDIEGHIADLSDSRS